MNTSLRKVLGESQEPLEIIEAERTEIYDQCPHCKKEIFERHEYTPDGGKTWFHSDCKGPIIFPAKRHRESSAKTLKSWGL